MRLRKRRTGRMVSIDEDVETEEGSMPRDLAEWRPDPEMMYGQSELAEILRKTIQGLPPGFRVVFVLRDVEGLSTEETAETLGLSVPAVKSRLLRARLQLRERLSRYFRKNEDGTQMNCSEFLAQLGDFLDNQVPTGLVADLEPISRDASTA